MQPILFSPLAIALSLVFSANAGAAILFSDTFDDSTTGAWHSGAASGTLTNASGAMSWSESGDGVTEILGRSIATTTVAIGETLRMTYSYTPAATNTIIRAGFFSLNGTITQNGWAYDSTALAGSYRGYNSFFRVNGGTPQAARMESGTISTSIAGGTANGPLQGGTDLGNLSGTGTAFTVAAGTTYTVTYEFVRTGASSITTTYTLNNGTSNVLQVSGSSTTATDFTFNAVTLRQTGGNAIYDNITLELIPAPEPSALVLSALGLGGVALRRRRKN